MFGDAYKRHMRVYADEFSYAKHQWENFKGEKNLMYKFVIPHKAYFNWDEVEVTRKNPIGLIRLGANWYIKVHKTLVNKINITKSLRWYNELTEMFDEPFVFRLRCTPAEAISFLKKVKCLSWSENKSLCKVFIAYPKL